ncbi:uncharacterized protein LOC124612629 [Schistocerca americana]|uniref:uncharacterized protein LOC124612629 n=1 Tax=Schistocerca americana TaxID=7009 RepID=UPI001F4FDEE6|nr:uncharacterized protein LOC124612629 [Schistocerca americana]XP_047114908.1 uncharacterized protein LOC124795104 [Schistocerca piceifrons]
MRRVELLDARVTDNIDKTDAVIARLRALDLRLSADPNPGPPPGPAGEALDARLISLDQKVSDIDLKLSGLKSQLDSNLLPADDINAEASEKKPISMSLGDVAKVVTAEVVTRVSRELEGLRAATNTVDRKLQFHINLVSENLGKVLSLASELHSAVLQPTAAPGSCNATTGGGGGGNLERLVRPLVGVAHKVDDVWDAVSASRGSLETLLSRTDDALGAAQRQQRTLADAHADLRSKANRIIAGLDQVEQRLKCGDVAGAASEPLLDAPLEAEPALHGHSHAQAHATEPLLPPPSPTPSLGTAAPPPPPPPLPATAAAAAVTTTAPPPPPQPSLPATAAASAASAATGAPPASSSAAGGRTPAPPAPRSRGSVIFPSVKNKPTIANNTFSTDSLGAIKDVKGYSCVDLLNAGMRDSGVYYLQIRGTTYWFLKVYCEQEVADGGWTVIQRRDDFGEPRESFNRDWADYKNGFGDPARELWLGNENIYMLTNNEDYVLRVELEDFEGNKRYAQYSHFKIYSEAEYYKLEVDGYEGNAGDSLNDPWYGSNNSPFSTYNRDNDRSSLNCASMLKGGWWWKSCGRGLNGLYLNDPQDLTARQGIVWFRWRGWDYTLKRAVMMIKPRASIPSLSAAGVNAANGGGGSGGSGSTA